MLNGGRMDANGGLEEDAEEGGGRGGGGVGRYRGPPPRSLSEEQLQVAEKYHALRRQHPWLQQRLVAYLADYGVMTISSLFRYKHVSDTAVNRARNALVAIEKEPEKMMKLLEVLKQKEGTLNTVRPSRKRKSSSPEVSSFAVDPNDAERSQNAARDLASHLQQQLVGATPPGPPHGRDDPPLLPAGGKITGTTPRRPRSTSQPVAVHTVSAAAWDVLAGPEEQSFYAAQLEPVPSAPGMMPLHHYEHGRDLESSPVDGAVRSTRRPSGWTDEVLVERAFDAYVRTRWEGQRALAEPVLIPVEVDTAKVGDDTATKAGTLPSEVVAWDATFRRGIDARTVVDMVQRRAAEDAAEVTRKDDDGDEGEEEDPDGNGGIDGTSVHPSVRREEPPPPQMAAERRLRRQLLERGIVPSTDPTHQTDVGENRRRLQLRLEVDDDEGRRRVLREELDWDLTAGEDLNSPEWFAQCLCTELGLGERNVRLVAHHIRQQLRDGDRHPQLPEVAAASTVRVYAGTPQERADAEVAAKEVIYEALGRTFGCVDLGVKRYDPKRHAKAFAPITCQQPAARRAKAQGRGGAGGARADAAAAVDPMAQEWLLRQQQHQMERLHRARTAVAGVYAPLEDLLEGSTAGSGSAKRWRRDSEYGFGGAGSSPLPRRGSFGSARLGSPSPEGDDGDPRFAHQWSRGASSGLSHMSTRRSNPLPRDSSLFETPGSFGRIGLDSRSPLKVKVPLKKERRDTPRAPRPPKPVIPVVNAIVHGLDLRTFRLNAYKTQELAAFRDGKMKARHNHAKGGGCIPCKAKLLLKSDMEKMRDVVRVYLREMRKLRGEPPEEEPQLTEDKQDTNGDEKPDENETKKPDERGGDKPAENESDKSNGDGCDKREEIGGDKPDENGGDKPDGNGGDKPDERGGGKRDENGGGKPDENGSDKPNENGHGKSDGNGSDKPDENGGSKPDENGGCKPDENGGCKPDGDSGDKPIENRIVEATKDAIGGHEKLPENEEPPQAEAT